MAVDLGSVGSVYVDVGADLSGLNAAISGAVPQGEALGQQIGVGISHGVAEGIGEAKEPVEGMTGSLLEMAEAFGLVLAGEEVVTMFRELVQESIEAYGRIELVTSGLTAFTGSAEETEQILSQIKTIASGSVFSLPELDQAAQKMAAIGVASSQIVPALQAVSDAAMVTGNSFGAVSSALDRIFLTGNLQPRSLMQLGISIQDVANTANMSVAEVKDAFEALGPQSDAALGILVTTIESRTHEAASAMTDDLLPSINSVKVEWDSLLEDFGKELTPQVKELLEGLKESLPVIQQVAIEFAKVAATSLGEIISDLHSIYNTFALIGTAVKDTGIGDLLGKLGGASGVIQGVVDSTLHLKEAGAAVSAWSDAWTGAVAVWDTLTGKSKSFDEAIASIDGLAAAQKEATQVDFAAEFTTAEKAGADRDGAQAALERGKQVAALNAALKDLTTAETTIANASKSLYTPAVIDLAAAQKGLTLAEQEQQQALNDLQTAQENLALIAYPDSKASAEALTAAQLKVNDAEAVVKGTTDTLTKSHQTLQASLKATNEYTALISATEKEYAATLSGQSIPTLQSLSDLESSLGNLESTRTDQFIAQEVAENNLRDLWNLGIRSGQEYADAVTALKNANAALAITNTAISATEKEISATRKDLATGTQQLAEDEKLLNATYLQIAPNTVSVTAALDALTTARANQVAAANALVSSELDLKIALAEEASGGPPATDAIAANRAAKEQLVVVNAAVNNAEKDLQTNFGLTLSAARLLTDATAAYQGSATQLADALKVSGQQSIEALDKQAEAALKAYQTIAAAAGDNSQQAQLAWLNAYQKMEADVIASGGSISAATQIEYADRVQKEKDYIADSITRWSDYYNSIHGDVANLFQGLTKDIFTGGDFEQTFINFAQKIGEDTMNVIFAPIEHAIEDWVSKTLSKLLSDALGSSIGGILGTGVGAATGATTLGTAAGTLQAGATTLQTAAATLQSAAASLQGAIGGQAAGHVGGATGGGAGGAAGSLVNTVTGVITAAASVATAIEGAFSIAEESNMKQSLNGIHNDTTMMNWKISNAGGVFDTSWWTSSNTLNLLDSFNGYKTFIINSVSDSWIGTAIHLSAIRYDLLTPISYDLANVAGSMSSLVGSIPQIGQAVASALTAQPPALYITAKFQIDSEPMIDSLVTILEQKYGLRPT